jgi:PAS domain S-box-containing protein
LSRTESTQGQRVGPGCDGVDPQRELALAEERYRLLSASLPGTTWTATPDGKIDHICEGSSAAPRSPTKSRLGEAWFELLHPDDRERIEASWRRAMRTGEPYDVQGRVRVADGSYRWHIARGVPQRDADGAIIRWVGLTVDIDAHRQADESREMFVALAENSSDIVGITDPDGYVVYANPAACEFLSLDDPRSIHFFDCFSAGDREFVKAVIVPEMERAGRWVGEFQMRNFRTGASLPILYNAFVLRNARGEKLGLATISRDLRERNRIDLGLKAVALAGAAMYDSLDYEQTLRNIADAVVKTFASSCTIDVADGHGTFRRVAIAHPRAEMRAILEDFTDQRRFQPRHPVFEAICNGVSTCVTDVDTWAVTKAASASTLAATASLGIRSFMTVPVCEPDGTVLGALTCSRDWEDPRPSFITDDLRFAEELARRACIAVQHARAYERERAIAVRFQEASLPRVLPHVAGLALSADYRPGSREATVGGDWYDAFLLEDGRLAITVGDVLGKGLDAAVTMTMLRQAMRSAAALLPEPNAMLAAADRTVRDVSADTYATAMAGIYDPQTRRFTFASAGHPGPTLLRADGSVEDYTSPGTMLGLRRADENNTVTFAPAPGSVLAFFTDGLTEATRDLDEGMQRLHAALAEHDGASENPARAIVDQVLRRLPASDDIAVLIMKFRPSE